MIALLSPAKTFNNTVSLSKQRPIFESYTNKLLNKLVNFSVNDFKTEFKISDNLSNKSYNYYKNFNNHYRAIELYGGTAFKHLDPKSINQEKSQKIFILSALYGLLRANDAISKYRIEMQYKGFGSLYDFWRIPINKYLKDNHKDDIIINLASKEYSEVLDLEGLNIITVNFANLDNGELKSPSMMVKKQRGLMARAIANCDIININDLKQLNINGYMYDSINSHDNYLLFVKGE